MLSPFAVIKQWMTDNKSVLHEMDLDFYFYEPNRYVPYPNGNIEVYNKLNEIPVGDMEPSGNDDMVTVYYNDGKRRPDQESRCRLSDPKFTDWLKSRFKELSLIVLPELPEDSWENDDEYDSW